MAATPRTAGRTAAQSVGQCGPCVNGLPSICQRARSPRRRGGDRRDRWENQLQRWLDLLEGRGACHHRRHCPHGPLQP
ncbi:MAG: NADH-ubiquinone oxidoreductase-F iron-sulfur binding region domain-containing protein [Acidimicrobiales bacterium]